MSTNSNTKVRPYFAEKGGAGNFLIALLIVAVFSYGIYTAMTSDNSKTNENMNLDMTMGLDAKNLRAAMAPKEYQKIAGTNLSTDVDSGPVVDTDLNKSASSAISASSAVVIADMNQSKAEIITPKSDDTPEKEGSIMNDIKYATKGDGEIRPVDVNTRTVDPTLVKLAMFENHDFMPYDETPGMAMPHLQDPMMKRQKSMFRPMTYPLVWQRGELGMDVRGETNDTRVTISFAGGIPPVMG